MTGRRNEAPRSLTKKNMSSRRAHEAWSRAALPVRYLSEYPMFFRGRDRTRTIDPMAPHVRFQPKPVALNPHSTVTPHYSLERTSLLPLEGFHRSKCGTCLFRCEQPEKPVFWCYNGAATSPEVPQLPGRGNGTVSSCWKHNWTCVSTAISSTQLGVVE